MKTITLLGGGEALVDDDVFDRVAGIRWRAVRRHKKVYAIYRYQKDKRYYSLRMQKLVLGLDASSPLIVDHINGNSLDNRRENLRIATDEQNRFNIRSVKSRSGFKGVFFYNDNRALPYRVYVKARKVNHCCGSFATAIEAAKAYDAMAIQLHGEFAATNKMLGLLP